MPAGPLRGLIAQERIAGDHTVHLPHHARESPLSPSAINSLSGIRIAQENGVVKVEEQARRRTAKQPQLPRRQQTPLYYDGVRILEVMMKRQPRPHGSRKGPNLQPMARLFEI